jgi:ribonucleoside-triphosphate reductase
MAQHLAEGSSFFVYLSDNADSLASCCRLRNEISDNTFSYTLGAGGVATGSINVITLNMNRLVQDKRDLASEVKKIQRYQVAYRKLMDDYLAAGMLNVYDAGFISLDKQFLTIGINGMVEAAESQGLMASNNPGYIAFVKDKLKIIFNENKAAKQQFGYLFNTEFVPAENLGVKNAKWDKADGYRVNRDCYNSYFYVVEDELSNPLDKFILHGRELVDYLDGGSALHLNLDEALSQEGYLSLLNVAAKTGCNYFCVNVKITICNQCKHIDKRTLHACSSCGSQDIDYGTRVIGYLKRVSSFSSGRRAEHSLRYYYLDSATSVTREDKALDQIAS